MMPVQGPAVLSGEREAFAGYARRLLREPFSRRYLMDRFYASLSFLLAVPCFVFIVLAVILGLSLSFSFAGMLAGVPLLVLSLLAARRLGGVCRGLAARLLGIRVAAPSPPLRPPGIVGWARAGLTNPAAWRACAYLVLKLPVALACVVVAGFPPGVRAPAQSIPELQRILEGGGIPVVAGEAGNKRHRVTGDRVPDLGAPILAGPQAERIAPCVTRQKSHQNEELLLAVEQLRSRQPDDPWLIPVRFDDCAIPDRDLGGRPYARVAPAGRPLRRESRCGRGTAGSGGQATSPAACLPLGREPR